MRGQKSKRALSSREFARCCARIADEKKATDIIINIANCLWYIVYTLINKKLLDKTKLNKILVEMYNFFKLYNNNYRPIYHLEKYILYIVAIVHELL